MISVNETLMFSRNNANKDSLQLLKNAALTFVHILLSIFSSILQDMTFSLHNLHDSTTCYFHNCMFRPRFYISNWNGQPTNFSILYTS